MTEAELEAAIVRERDLMIFAQTRESRVEHWQKMCALIAQRSPETIERMEKEQGLI